MLIDAHVHIFPKVDGYGPKGHTHGAGYGRIDAGDGIAQDVLPAINEKPAIHCRCCCMRCGRDRWIKPS